VKSRRGSVFLAHAERLTARSDVQTRSDVHERLKSLVKVLTYRDWQLEPSDQAEIHHVPRWILWFETPRNPASCQMKRLDLHRHIATDDGDVPRCVLCICARFPPCQPTQPTALSRLRPPPVHHHFDQDNETSKLDEDDIPRNTTSNPVLY
jgi:hypothetical protein